MGRLDDIGLGSGAIIAAGVGLLLVAVAHHTSEIRRVGELAGPLAALLLDGGPAVGLIYAGSWLAGTDLDSGSARRVALWCLLGGVVFALTIALSMGIRIAEGRTIVEPVFVLLVTAEAGALAGFVAGYYRTRALVDKRRAERAADSLSLVNSIVRHDLRNDFQIIDAYAELIATGEADDADGHAATIRETVAGARERLDDTEAVAKTITGQGGFESVDLTGIVSEVGEHVEELYGVTVETDLPDSAYVSGNEGLRSIVDNLLENAAEHNDSDDPRVEVSVEPRDGTVRLVVRDNGPGLPERARATLAGSDPDGTGGGLRIVRRLVSEYGGDISVRDDEARGAAVAVDLPAGHPGRVPRP